MVARFTPKFDFSDLRLFGSEIAEDEDEDTFFSYAMKRPEVDSFCDQAASIRLVRAYKGEGKSALLRLAQSEVRREHPGAILIEKFAPDLSPSVATDDYDEWLRSWKKSIFALAASEIGARIGFAYNDDGMTLVEIAERNGFRRRSFVSTILDRFKLPSKVAPEYQRPASTENVEALVTRWKAQEPGIWFFVDDLDRNFQNTPRNSTKIAAFLEACRHIHKSAPNFYFRTSIRPNTWATIKPHHESLSHLSQCMIDLKWSEEQVLKLLGLRVEAYLRRTGQLTSTESSYNIPPQGDERHKGLMSMAFQTPVNWGRHQRPIHVPLYTLAQKRPRWLIELCRNAASVTAERQSEKIEWEDIDDALPSFSGRRVEDIVAEFKPQCPQVQELIDAFRHQYDHMKTDEIMKIINNNIVQHVNVQINGKRSDGRQIASFLFEIGIICARQDFDDDSYEHIYFTDQPSLFISRTDTDSGYTWEVPPAFRKALELKARRDLVITKVPRSSARRRRRVP